MRVERKRQKGRDGAQRGKREEMRQGAEEEERDKGDDEKGEMEKVLRPESE